MSERSVAASGILAIARALGDAMPPAAAVQTFDALSQSAPVDVDLSARTASGRALAVNLVASYRNLRLAALAAYCEAIVRSELSDRRAALTLRANAAEYFEAEMDRLTADHSDLYNAMTSLRNATVDFLSRAVLDLAPVIRCRPICRCLRCSGRGGCIPILRDRPIWSYGIASSTRHSCRPNSKR